MNPHGWTHSEAAITWGLRELYAPRLAPSLVERVLAALDAPIDARVAPRLGRSSRRAVWAVAAAAALVVTLWFGTRRPDPSVRFVGSGETQDDASGVDRAGLDEEWALLVTDLAAVRGDAIRDPEFAARVEHAPDSLVFLCQDSPRAWDHLRSKFAAVDVASLVPSVRLRVFTCAVHDPSEAGIEWVLDGMQQWPEAFTSDALLHYAATQDVETPNDLLQQRLIDALDAGRADDEWIVVGAHLALRGDPTPQAMLDGAVGAVHPKLGRELVDRRLAAAIGLRVLGDPAAWKRVRDEARDVLEKGLITGDLADAQWLALRASYFARAIDGERPSLAYLSASIDRFAQSAAPQPLSASAIQAKLDALPE